MRQEKGRGLKPPTLRRGSTLHLNFAAQITKEPRSRKQMMKFLHTYFGIQRNNAQCLCWYGVQQHRGKVSYLSLTHEWTAFVIGELFEEMRTAAEEAQEETEEGTRKES